MNGDREYTDALAELDAAAAAGEPTEPQVDIDLLWEALGTVIDPEIGLDLVTLGLIYQVDVSGGNVRVTHSLTTPGCPLEHYITEAIKAAVFALPGVDDVETNLVWEPRWSPEMIKEGA